VIKMITKIKNLIPVVLGIIQVVLPIIKEILVGLTRICEVVFFWTDIDEKVIAFLNKYYDIVNNFVEKIKRWLLGMGWTI